MISPLRRALYTADALRRALYTADALRRALYTADALRRALYTADAVRRLGERRNMLWSMVEPIIRSGYGAHALYRPGIFLW